MENEQTERLRNAAIRLTMMPRDTNAHGTVFGGVILSYIDVAGGVGAVRATNHDRFVTVAMKEVIFHEPVFYRRSRQLLRRNRPHRQNVDHDQGHRRSRTLRQSRRKRPRHRSRSHIRRHQPTQGKSKNRTITDSG